MFGAEESLIFKITHGLAIRIAIAQPIVAWSKCYAIGRNLGILFERYAAEIIFRCLVIDNSGCRVPEIKGIVRIVVPCVNTAELNIVNLCIEIRNELH